MTVTIQHTHRGTPYLTEPHAILIGRPQSLLMDNPEIYEYLEGLGFDPHTYFDEDFQFSKDSEQLMKYAGQGCYLSYGQGHTGWADEDLTRYFDNQKQNHDGSVFEHNKFTFQAYGISRSLTHELVRHRVDYGFSQVSQRYVDGQRLRFVQGPEYGLIENADSPEESNQFLHLQFEHWIDACAHEYELRSDTLVARMLKLYGQPSNREERVTRRKMANSAARRCLPNETEAPLVFSANIRSLRHTLEMRTHMTAETEIRRLFDAVYEIMAFEAPHLFNDYTAEQLPDGSIQYTTPWPKA